MLMPTPPLPRCKSRLSFVLLGGVLLAGVPAWGAVDFAQQVHPIFVKKCFACHSAAVKQGGLSVETLAALTTGGAHGPSLVPGSASESHLYRRVAGLAEPRMPMGMTPLNEKEIDLLRDWINEGAK